MVVLFIVFGLIVEDLVGVFGLIVICFGDIWL